MHMTDALIAPAVAVTMYAASAGTGAYSIKKISLEEDQRKLPLMSVMGAFVFASQMINLTIPGTGSSGHLTGGLLLSALLGPHGGFLTMSVILIIQSLLFADGGILALGCNVWNMAFYSCFFGYYCIYKPIIKGEFTRRKIIIASMLASILSLQLGAFSVTLQTLASGITEIPFSKFVMAMQPIHLGVGILEGLITSAILIFIYEVRPEILTKEEGNDRISFKKILIILSITVLIIGGGLSLFASSNPDGLEWSIEQVTGNSELHAEGEVYNKMSDIQEKTAILPDYSFINSDNEILGTSFSGVIGSIIVFIILVGIFKIFNKLRKNAVTE